MRFELMTKVKKGISIATLIAGFGIDSVATCGEISGPDGEAQTLKELSDTSVLYSNIAVSARLRDTEKVGVHEASLFRFEPTLGFDTQYVKYQASMTAEYAEGSLGQVGEFSFKAQLASLTNSDAFLALFPQITYEVPGARGSSAQVPETLATSFFLRTNPRAYKVSGASITPLSSTEAQMRVPIDTKEKAVLNHKGEEVKITNDDGVQSTVMREVGSPKFRLEQKVGIRVTPDNLPLSFSLGAGIIAGYGPYYGYKKEDSTTAEKMWKFEEVITKQTFAVEKTLGERQNNKVSLAVNLGQTLNSNPLPKSVPPFEFVIGLKYGII